MLFFPGDVQGGFIFCLKHISVHIVCVRNEEVQLYDAYDGSEFGMMDEGV